MHDNDSLTSVTLVEQELWQTEEKGVIGILPVRDDAEIKAVGSVLSPGSGSEFGEASSKTLVGLSDTHKPDGKSAHEVIHWHNRGVAARALHLSRGVEKPSGKVTYVVVKYRVYQMYTPGSINVIYRVYQTSVHVSSNVKYRIYQILFLIHQNPESTGATIPIAHS